MQCRVAALPAKNPAMHVRHARRASLPVLVMMLLGAASSGCALTSLTLDPSHQARSVQAPSRGQGREIVLVAPFDDNRTITHRCGMKKNGYNWDTADIHCQTAPNLVLAQLLQEALLAAGFQVRTTADAVSPSTLRVAGSLTMFFVEPKVGAFTFSPEADIEVHLTATTATGLRAERRFYSKAVATALAGTDARFQQAYDTATRVMIDRLVDAIVALAHRYPAPAAPRVATAEVQR
jgi:hypothetical protein